MRFQTILIALAAGLANAKTLHTISLDPAAEIRNVLAHYCIILDTKTYSDLSSVYTPDAIANFTTIGLGVLSGLPAIQKAMNTSLYTLEQFGTGAKAGQLFTVWGKWEDQLVNDDGWKVKNRQVVAMGGPLIGNFVVPTH
ncbi:hypothetical protein ACEPPN_001185 [Leptodophora sp. 'Broadleaf-Isolate-01']